MAVVALLGGVDAGSWPGGDVHVADQAGALGQNVSGVVSAVGHADVVWAVRDDPGQLLRLEAEGDQYVVDPDWGDGRKLRWPDRTGEPDAEAVTTAADRSDVVYVAAERDNDDPSTSRQSVLEVPVTDDGSGKLVATRSWDLTSELPAAEANTGIEGLAWVPDTAFVAAGFVDDAGVAYVPADHPGHGTGLFVTGSETDGRLDVFVLGDLGVEHLATVASGLPSVMDLTWDTSGQLWAVCDDHCEGRMARLTPASIGFAVQDLVDPPTALAELNDEGFTIGPCTGGAATAVWSDDAADDDHALRTATLVCGAAPAAEPTRAGSVIGKVVAAVAAAAVVAAGAAFLFLGRRRRYSGSRRDEA